jgi:hypothetical protein
MMSGDSSTVVEYWFHHPKVKGLSPSTAVPKVVEKEGGKLIEMKSLEDQQFPVLQYK